MTTRTGRTGYTLVEIIIVIGITALMVGVVISYNSGGRRQVELSVERAKVSQVMYRARSLAVAMYREASPPCGYGVYFDYAATPQQYYLYAYDDTTCSFASLAGKRKEPPLGTYKLGSGVRFATHADSLQDVIFFPPDPRVELWIGDNTSTTANGVLYVETTDGVASGTLKITPTGQITTR